MIIIIINIIIIIIIIIVVVIIINIVIFFTFLFVYFPSCRSCAMLVRAVRHAARLLTRSAPLLFLFLLSFFFFFLSFFYFFFVFSLLNTSAARSRSTFAGDVAEARADPAAFWGRAAAQVHWHRPWTTVLGGTPEHPQWFDGGELNMAYVPRRCMSWT